MDADLVSENLIIHYLNVYGIRLVDRKEYKGFNCCIYSL